MPSSPLHPAIVHLPLALSMLVPILAAGVLVAWWRERLPGRSWWIVVGLQAALTLGAFAALQTGSGEEERVERVVGEAALEAHEEAAEVFTGAAVVALLLLVAPLLIRREGLGRRVAAAGVVGSLVVTGLALQVGRKGGDLVYRHGAASAYAAPGAAATAPMRGGEQDDDDG